MEQPITSDATQEVIPQAPVSPPEGIVSAPTPENSRKPFLKPLVVLIIFLLIILGVVAYFIFYKKPQQQATSRTFVSPTQSPVTTTTDTLSDSFATPTLSEHMWGSTTLGENPTFEVRDGKLYVETPGVEGQSTSIVFDSKTLVDGDLEAILEVELLDAKEGGLVSFVLHDDIDGWPNQLAIHLDRDNFGLVTIRAISVFNGVSSELASGSYAQSGPFSLRIERNGGRAIFSLKDSGSFVPFAEADTNIFNGGVKSAFTVDSFEPQSSRVFAAFDNFVLKLL